MSSVRPLSLTPQEVSTNVVLEKLIPDITRKTYQGYECSDLDGSVLQFFLEVCEFFEDYPAFSQVVDVLNHDTIAPCTHCKFHHRGKMLS